MLPPLEEMIGQLIAVPSVSSVNAAWDQSNEAIIDLLATWATDIRCRIEKTEIPGRPGKFNLTATIGQGQEGLVLAGHTDTVPFDEHLWSSDPFKLSRRDGRLYGLGVADMKSFFGMVLDVLKHIELKNIKRPIIVVATADEESNMSGARALLRSGEVLGKHVVIGEPTGGIPIRMHKGISLDAVRLIGKSGHSSNPELGINALEGMQPVISEIIKWRTELQSQFKNTGFEVPVPTVNLGVIRGGDNPNRICGECELQFDIRPLPGMSLENLRQQLAARLRTLFKDSALTLEVKRLFEGIPPMETPGDAAIVVAAEKLTGFKSRAVAFGTEGTYYNAMGMQTVVLGPANIAQAHQPDEYLEESSIAPYQQIVKGLIEKFCLSG